MSDQTFDDRRRDVSREAQAIEVLVCRVQAEVSRIASEPDWAQVREWANSIARRAGDLQQAAGTSEA